MTKKRNKLLMLLLALVLVFSACGGKDAENDGQDSSAVQEEVQNNAEEHTGFYVDGGVLYDANGNPFVMRGINHAHTWFADKLFLTLDAVKDTGSNCVRIVLSDGEQWNEDAAGTVAGIIKACKDRNLIAILEVHDATGYNDKESLLAAAQYFVDIKDVLIGEEAYVIINIANEWMGNSTTQAWKEAYVEAIPMLREAGLTHTIMVDSAGWGQYAKCIAEGGREVFDADPLANVMFSIHMYGTAGGDAEKIETNLKYATDNGFCVCVGEFGYTHTDGDVDEAFLMQYCVENQIGYIAWSWKGNGGGVEYLDLAAQWDGRELSSDWGEVVVNGTNGIRETSLMCTVFEE